MDQHRTGHKTLSEPIIALFTEAYMRHSTSMSLKVSLLSSSEQNLKTGGQLKKNRYGEWDFVKLEIEMSFEGSHVLQNNLDI